MNYIGTINKLKLMLQTSPVFLENVYLVGGCVRDLLLGEEPKDIDLCIDVPNGIEEFSKWLKDNFSDSVSGFCEFPRYGTMKFTLHLDTGETSEIECVIPRKETYNSGPRKPDQVTQTTISIDAHRRDFCCNALYKKLSDDSIYDPTGFGLKDCKNKVLSTPMEAVQTFIDDPLRMLRAIRFHCTKGFNINEKDLDAIEPYPEYFSLSMERIRDEFEKILMSSRAVEGIILLHNHKLLERAIPELELAWDFDQESKYHSLNLRDHLFSVLSLVIKSPSGNDLRLRWAALLHDISKYRNYTWDGKYRHYKMHELYSSDAAEKILKRLKYDNNTIYDVSKLIKHHMRLKQLYDYKTQSYTGSTKSIRKFISTMGHLLDLELELIDADNMSHAPKYNMPGQIDDLRKKIEELEITSRKNPGIGDLGAKIDGNDIMKFLNIDQGITVKEVKLILQDYLDEDPDLSKEDLFTKYLSEFHGTFLMIQGDYDDVEMTAMLDDVSINFPIRTYFGKNPPSEKIIQVLGIKYPVLYRRLIREKKARVLINIASKSIVNVSLLDGFRGIQLSLENGDLCATVTWDDGTTTDIL